MSENEQDNENRDTLDDVLAEMLERADAMQTHGTTHGVRLAIREFVSRIKAARKRERSKVEADALAVGGVVEAARHKPVGNAAAMREALVTAKKAICHHAEYVCRKLACENGNTQSNCIIMLCAHRDLCEAKTAIQEALSAPARNCDLYDDAEIAWRAWLDDKENWDEFGGSKLELHEWLFASAKKKGEGDGSK